MDNIKLETIKLRLEVIRQAIARTRTTLVISIITSVAIFITAWNAYHSWHKEFVMQRYRSKDSLFTESERATGLKELSGKHRIDINELKTANVDPALLEDTKIKTDDLSKVTELVKKTSLIKSLIDITSAT